MEGYFITQPNGVLVPDDEDTKATVLKKGVGKALKFVFSTTRNSDYHRKFMKMIRVGYDAWQPEVTRNGITATKSFERFRKDVIISAGYYYVTINIKGEYRKEAESISFAKMDQEEFEKVYSACADVLLEGILVKYTREELDNVVNELLGFI